MNAYEILLSKSQERMLMIVKKGYEKNIEDIFKKWDLHAVAIGTVENGTQMKVFHHGQCVVDVPAKALAEDSPVYERETERPKSMAGLTP